MSEIKVELLDWWRDDKAIAHTAWASSYDQEKLADKTELDIHRVVTTVINQHHQTPKERVWLEFFITCPIAVERQLDKYRMSAQYQDIQVEAEVGAFGRYGITQNELSGRYRTIPDRFLRMPEDVAKVFDKVSHYGFMWRSFWETNIEKQHQNYESSLAVLKEAENVGKITNAEYKRAREVLRMELGTAYMTDMRWLLNLGAFENVMNQRLTEAQMETRVVAYLMLQQVLEKNVAPVAVSEMCRVNGWDKWQKEIEEWIQKNL